MTKKSKVSHNGCLNDSIDNIPLDIGHPMADILIFVFLLYALWREEGGSWEKSNFHTLMKMMKKINGPYSHTEMLVTDQSTI